jgi:hypothetical protein
MRFNEEDRRRMKQMKASGAKLREIGALFGATVGQVHNIVSPKPSLKGHSWMIRLIGMLGQGNIVPPEPVLLAAIERAEYPRTFTQWHLGDPVLDQCVLHPNHFSKLKTEKTYDEASREGKRTTGAVRRNGARFDGEPCRYG